MILIVGQRKIFAVGAFAVLMRGFIESAYKNHHVGLLGGVHGIGYQAVGRTVIVEILPGGDAVVFAGNVAHISTLICHLNAAIGSLGAQSVEWQCLALHL